MHTTGKRKELLEKPSPQKGEAAAKAKAKTKTSLKEVTHGEVDLRHRVEERTVEAKGKTKAKIEADQSREEEMSNHTSLPTRKKLIEENLHREKRRSRFADLGLEGPATRVKHAISATLECASIT